MPKFCYIIRILLYYQNSIKLLIFYITRILLCHGISLPEIHHITLPEFHCIYLSSFTLLEFHCTTEFHYITRIPIMLPEFCHIIRIQLHYRNSLYHLNFVVEFHYITLVEFYFITRNLLCYFTRILLHNGIPLCYQKSITVLHFHSIAGILVHYITEVPLHNGTLLYHQNYIILLKFHYITRIPLCYQNSITGICLPNKE